MYNHSPGRRGGRIVHKYRANVSDNTGSTEHLVIVSDKIYGLCHLCERVEANQADDSLNKQLTKRLRIEWQLLRGGQFGGQPLWRHSVRRSDDAQRQY